jgi:hypothetical protein
MAGFGEVMGGELATSFAADLRLCLLNGVEIDSVESGLESSLIGEFALCCFALFISAIHDGCSGGACAATLGFSSFVNADSSQLDLVGLHLFDGLAGDPGTSAA